MNKPVVAILASGPSAKDFDLSLLPEGSISVGVNDTGVLKDTTYGLSMDRVWTENRIKDINKPYYIRHSVYDRVKGKNPYLNSIYINHLTSEVSLEPMKLNGRNSGFAAFNFGVHLCLSRGIDTIFITGFDMSDGKAHWHDEYVWSDRVTGDRYRKWLRDFDPSVPILNKLGIKVFNISTISRVDNFPKLTLVEALSEYTK